MKAKTKPKVNMTSPIKLQRAYDISQVKSKKNKVVDGGDTTEFDIPVLTSVTRSNAEQMLAMVRSFNTTFVFARWTVEKKFLKFKMHLQGTALAGWQTIVSTSALRTQDQFNAFVLAFKRKYLKMDDKYLQQDYLRDVKKPYSMGVGEFFQRFAEIHMLLGKFPDATIVDLFNEQEYKRLLLKAMPIEWQRSFTLAGHRINTTDLLTLEEYFVETESIMDSTRGHKDNKKKKDGNDSSDANGDTEKKKKGTRKLRKPQSQGGNGKSRTRLDNDATCPIHGKHKWGQCYENRFGENYKPPTAATSTTSANDQSKKSSKSKKDAHATESVDDDEDTEDSFLCQEGTSVAD
ncbi:MAG: hypothetical protein ACRDEA_14000, partial [Microcystaceae cyanobacterium]